MKTSQSLPTRGVAVGALAALMLLSWSVPAFGQNVANINEITARKRPNMVTRTPITLAPLAQLILDPTFEVGDPWPDWTTQSSTNFSTPICNTALCGTGGGSAPPFGGDNWAWFGGIPAPETATLGQVITIPSGVTATLTFQMRIGAVNAPFDDTLTVKMDGTTLQTFVEPATAETVYTLRTFDVSAFADGGSHTLLFTYVGNSSGTANFTVDDVNLNTSTAAPLLLNSAVSRKVHGAAGPFDINLPSSAPFGVECRSGGGSYQFVFTFSNNVVSGGASVTAGTGSVSGSPSFAGNTMTVNLTGVADVQTLTVTLTNVTDTSAQVLASTSISARMLIGDTNGSGGVSAADVGQTKAQSGNPATAANFRTDTNASGGISAADVGQVKAASGHSVP